MEVSNQDIELDRPFSKHPRWWMLGEEFSSGVADCRSIVGALSIIFGHVVILLNRRFGAPQKSTPQPELGGVVQGAAAGLPSPRRVRPFARACSMPAAV